MGRKKYIIWGTGLVTRSVINQELISKIDWFVDNNADGTYLGKEIKRPDTLDNEDRENIIVIIAAYDKSRNLIALELERMGFVNYKNYFYFFQWQGDDYLPPLCGLSRWNESHYINDPSFSRKGTLRYKIGLSMTDWENAKTCLDIGEGQCRNDLLLPPNINYIGIDFVKRSDKTIICDFNKFEFPDVRDADIVFVMGCYEWVRDGRWLLRKSAGALKAGGQFFTTSYYGSQVKEFTGYMRNWCYFMFPYELILYLKELGLELVDGRDCNLEHQILKFIKRGGDSK